MVMRFLQHPSSSTQDVSDEISLNFPNVTKSGEEIAVEKICPTAMTIHETFPFLLFQDNTHFCSFGLTQKLYDKIKEKQLDDLQQKFCDIGQY
jgi:hypothetical protein